MLRARPSSPIRQAWRNRSGVRHGYVAQIDGAHAGDLVDVLIDNNGFLVLAKSSQTRCSPEIAYGLWLPIVPGATLPVAQSPYPTNRPVRNLGATGRNAGFEGLAHAWIDSARSFDCDSA